MIFCLPQRAACLVTKYKQSASSPAETNSPPPTNMSFSSVYLEAGPPQLMSWKQCSIMRSTQLERSQLRQHHGILVWAASATFWAKIFKDKSKNIHFFVGMLRIQASERGFSVWYSYHWPDQKSTQPNPDIQLLTATLALHPGQSFLEIGLAAVHMPSPPSWLSHLLTLTLYSIYNAPCSPCGRVPLAQWLERWSYEP